MLRVRFCKLMALLTVAWAGCQSADQHSNTTVPVLGDLHHQFPVSDSAKPHFEKGLLLLHSFEYDDAREAFQAAHAADASEVMALWGETMTHYKALWGLQDIDAGQAVMQRLGPSPEVRLQQAEAGIERDFWQGLEFLYGPGELKARNTRYTEHMKELYERYPGNEEVAAFYALGLMWSGDLGTPSEEAETAARVAQSVLAENPNHPGALHYTIHAYDNPAFAPRAVAAANRYAEVAPDATHALHMPSHIYLALGMWDEVVSSNEASYAASVARMQRKQLGDGARGYHSYAWLHYGYLQQGRHARAREQLEDMLEYVASEPHQSARSYLIMMQCNQLAESGMSPGNFPYDTTVNTKELSINTVAAHHWFRAVLAQKRGNKDEIIRERESLSQKIEVARLSVTDEGVAMCSAGATRYAPNENAIRLATVILYQIKSLEAQLDADWKSYETALNEASSLEQNTDYAFGPPDIPQPALEQYGQWLLEQGRPEAALAQFTIALERAPGRSHALLGKLRALTALGQEEKASALTNDLQQIWHLADPNIRQQLNML